MKMSKGFYTEKDKFYRGGDMVHERPTGTRPIISAPTRVQNHVLGWNDMAAWLRQLEK